MPSHAGSRFQEAIHPGLTLQTSANQMAVLRGGRYGKTSTTAGVIERVFLQRYTGGTTPTTRTEKHNTRSPTATALARTWGTGPTASGNPLVIIDCGDKPVLQQYWRPPRPRAAIYLIDADIVGIDANCGANNSTQYAIFWSEHDPGIDDRPLRGRRPSRPGLFHYHNHCNIIRGGIATNPRTPLRLNYCDELDRLGRRWQSPNTLWLLPAPEAPPPPPFISQYSGRW